MQKSTDPSKRFISQPPSRLCRFSHLPDPYHIFKQTSKDIDVSELPMWYSDLRKSRSGNQRDVVKRLCRINQSTVNQLHINASSLHIDVREQWFSLLTFFSFRSLISLFSILWFLHLPTNHQQSQTHQTLAQQQRTPSQAFSQRLAMAAYTATNHPASRLAKRTTQLVSMLQARSSQPASQNGILSHRYNDRCYQRLTHGPGTHRSTPTQIVAQCAQQL